MEEKITNNVGKEDYYEDRKGRKVLDFCIGFFGSFLVFAVIAYLSISLVLGSILPNFNLSGNILIFPLIQIPLIIFLLVQFFLFKYFNKINRRYIKYGALGPVIILALIEFAVLVFLGSCAFSPPGW